MAEQNSIVCTYRHIKDILFIQLFVDGHLGCFQLSVIVNNAAMNIGIQYNWQQTEQVSI